MSLNGNSVVGAVGHILVDDDAMKKSPWCSPSLGMGSGGCVVCMQTKKMLHCMQSASFVLCDVVAQDI